jgi:CHAD domain-containing protein
MYGEGSMVTHNQVATDPVPYAEADKLGPLGTKTAVLLDPKALRAALIAEFTAAADAARDAAALADRGTATAVHDSRKALRRARAALSLFADALPNSERRAVTAALKLSRRALSVARDHAVAPHTLAQLAIDGPLRDTANAVLTNAADAMPPLAEIKRALAESAARAASQAQALDAALPQKLEWKTIASGVSEVYARARRARREAKDDTAAFHTWRRRSKELVYQLDLLRSYAGSRVAELYAEVDDVTDMLSPAVDLIMVREFVRTYAQGVAPDAIDALVDAIDDQIADLMKRARKAGRDLYDDKPNKFAKRLSKAVRRDLETPQPHG